MSDIETFNSFLTVLDDYISKNENIEKANIDSAILCKRLIDERKLIFWGFDEIRIWEDGTVSLNSNDLISPLFFMLIIKNESDIVLWIVNRTVKEFSYSKKNISQLII